MATMLERPVIRETEAPRGGRPLLVKMTREGLYVREKGRRTWYGPLTWGKALMGAARVQAEELKRLKAERRAARRSQRGAR